MLKLINRFFTLGLGIIMTQVAFAVPVPVDLRSWTVEEVPGAGSSNWNPNVSPPDYNEVFQSNNSRPSIFFDFGTNAQGTALTGNIKVETTSDNDFIGFVLGYDSGEAGSATTDFMLIDWKQGDQGTAVDGLAISRVTSATAENDFWAHIGGVDEIARASNLGSTGWNDNQSYLFELTFTSSLIEIFVDSVKEISITAADAGIAAFDDGAFGFYNYSQSSVRYSGVFEDVLPPTCGQPGQPPCPSHIPEPSTIALLCLGIVGFGFAHRKKH